MSLPPAVTACIAAGDLATLAEVASLRFPLRAAESRRLERMRTLLSAANDVGQALGAYTHCTLVNCQGSHGVGSMHEHGERFVAALARYAELVRDVAAEYRHHVEGGQPSPPLLAPLQPARLEVA
jgi:hypothetical protein